MNERKGKMSCGLLALAAVLLMVSGGANAAGIGGAGLFASGPTGVLPVANGQFRP